jgi:hypothetical protein
MERSFEYDAFGPWIYEINEEHTIPRLFRDNYREDLNPLLLFKVPRRIERRAASPSMDLYDYLIGAFDTYIHIWRRAGKNVVEKCINYSDIFAVRDEQALLKGELMLYTESEPIVIDYNTVSEGVILKLINIIENKISGPSREIASREIPIYFNDRDPRSLNMLYFNLLTRLKEANPASRLAAYQPRIYTKPQISREAFWNDIRNSLELKQKLKDRTLARFAFIINDKELIILESRTWKRNTPREELGYSFLYVPLQNIRGAFVYAFDEWYGLSIAEIQAGNKTFEYICENTNADIREVCGALSAVAGNSV